MSPRQLVSPAARRAIEALSLFAPTEEQARVLLACYIPRRELTRRDWETVIAAFRPRVGSRRVPSESRRSAAQLRPRRAGFGESGGVR